MDILHESCIEIRDRETFEVVTVIELLSPTNKNAGSDREQSFGKRKVIYRINSHLVAIDLLRGGERMPAKECRHAIMLQWLAAAMSGRELNCGRLVYAILCR